MRVELVLQSISALEANLVQTAQPVCPCAVVVPVNVALMNKITHVELRQADRSIPPVMV